MDSLLLQFEKVFMVGRSMSMDKTVIFSAIMVLLCTMVRFFYKLSTYLGV